MHNEIGAVVLGGLSAMFGGFSIRELAIAYKTTALKEWGERAVPGTGSVILAALFGVMTLQILG